ncbi:MAG: proton-conducting membrane transporter, partial [Lachnospiraceae bacterium]|nr:proton-conducting membrane transporter [Lachnospiraceae bacterium]
LLMLKPFANDKVRNIVTECLMIVTTVIVFFLIFTNTGNSVVLFKFTRNLQISLRLDQTGSIFAGMVAFLWPLATLYSFEYMEHEERRRFFFALYTMTYGVTLGIAMSENILTMYFFYEMLTMVTIPLVGHTLTKEAVKAARTYMVYSIGGAAFAFIGMIFALVYGTTADFVPGGVFNISELGSGMINALLIVYVLCFCGFSVKAAMFPFSSWLPTAGVAPTPVTALLHAVAVVKAGAFATLRVTYFIFGWDLLKGTWAQQVLLCLAIFTVVYGCSRALKETHFKRRLAWSTVSNLSYILFGVLLMSPAGLTGALLHMLCHAVMKICSFFCAGAIIEKTGKHFIHEYDGMGRKMPFVFTVFTISGLALMGVPGLSGFVSKWYLAKAGLYSGSILGKIGVGAILVSAILTAIYMMTVSIRGFYPNKDFTLSSNLSEIKDPGWKMKLPLCIFVILMFVFGLRPALLENLVDWAVQSVFFTQLI